MSQHLMGVTHLSGATLKLVAGFDPRLREFFLSVRDARFAAPDETPEKLSGEAEKMEMTSCVCSLPLELCDFQCPEGLHVRADFEQY